jgi:hypothetical protein
MGAETMSRNHYSHAFELNFEVMSRQEDASDVSEAMIMRALRKEIRRMTLAEATDTKRNFGILATVNRCDTIDTRDS